MSVSGEIDNPLPDGVQALDRPKLKMFSMMNIILTSQVWEIIPHGNILSVVTEQKIPA